MEEASRLACESSPRDVDACRTDGTEGEFDWSARAASDQRGWTDPRMRKRELLFGLAIRVVAVVTYVEFVSPGSHQLRVTTCPTTWSSRRD
jgi:hypothetical protein